MVIINTNLSQVYIVIIRKVLINICIEDKNKHKIPNNIGILNTVYQKNFFFEFDDGSD